MADSVTGGARPTAGDVWRLNLYRIERKGGRNLKSRLNDPATFQTRSINTTTSKPSTRAWSETYQRGFHHPARFGAVQFAE